MPRKKSHSRRIVLTALAPVVASVLGLSCSSGPSGPVQGSPEWYMQAAGDNFAIPDYAKTIEQLSEAMRADGEIGTRAMLWHSVTTAGLARGYAELSNAFLEGIEANEARAADFQNFVNDYRRRTRINAIEFSEGVGKIQALIEAQPSVSLDFPLPPGNDSVSPVLTSARSGNNVESQIPGMEDQTLTRGIFSILSDLTGGKIGRRTGLDSGNWDDRGDCRRDRFRGQSDSARHFDHVRSGGDQRPTSAWPCSRHGREVVGAVP